MAEIASNTEYLGRLIVRCVAYGGLYLTPESKPSNYSNLKLAVEELYLAILKFLVETAEHLDRKTPGILRLSTYILFISLILPHRPHIEGSS